MISTEMVTDPYLDTCCQVIKNPLGDYIGAFALMFND